MTGDSSVSSDTGSADRFPTSLRVGLLTLPAVMLVEQVVGWLMGGDNGYVAAVPRVIFLLLSCVALAVTATAIVKSLLWLARNPRTRMTGTVAVVALACAAALLTLLGIFFVMLM